MFKKLLIGLLILGCASCFANDNQQSSSVDNPPSVGSRQGSSQIFGEQKLSEKPKKHYYQGDKNKSNRPNKPTQGSRDGSNQVFGEPPITNKTSVSGAK
jgi:hypothetical protein